MEALVFAGGDAVHERWHAQLPADGLVIAADSGLEHVHALGLRADVVVGDMDSVDPATLDRAIAAGTRVERYSTWKDATDLELALATAKRAGATRVTVLGTDGGRLDHFLANALLLSSPKWADLEIDALVGEARVVVVRHAFELHGRVGSLVTLLPSIGPARGVRTTGLRWALEGEELPPGSTRGVSNEMTEPIATVSLTEGVLLAIQPHGGC